MANIKVNGLNSAEQRTYSKWNPQWLLNKPSWYLFPTCHGEGELVSVL